MDAEYDSGPRGKLGEANSEFASRIGEISGPRGKLRVISGPRLGGKLSVCLTADVAYV